MFDIDMLKRDIEWDVLFQHQFTSDNISAFEEGEAETGACSCRKWKGRADTHNTHVATAMTEWLLLRLTANGEDMAEAVATFKAAWAEADTMHREGLRTQSGIEALVSLGWRKVVTNDA